MLLSQVCVMLLSQVCYVIILGLYIILSQVFYGIISGLLRYYLQIKPYYLWLYTRLTTHLVFLWIPFGSEVFC